MRHMNINLNVKMSRAVYFSGRSYKRGSLQRTADALNRDGHLLNGQPIHPKDVSAAILSKPQKDDLLHQSLRKLYKKRTPRSKNSLPPNRIFYKI